MSGWNLPPGCRVSDIPGNRPEDLSFERARDAEIDTLREDLEAIPLPEWAVDAALDAIADHPYFSEWVAERAVDESEDPRDRWEDFD